MEKEKEFFDVEPEAKDIMSIWGLELTSYNLVKVSLLSRSHEAKVGEEKYKWNLVVGIASLKGVDFTSSQPRSLDRVGIVSQKSSLVLGANK